MAEAFENVEVSAVLITDADGRYLLDFNDKWGGFTFPMSKRHEHPPSVPGGATAMEPWEAAAVRAAAEVLGRPLPPASLRSLSVDLEPWNQSGRDRKWRRYSFRLFGLTTKLAPVPVSGHSAVWLTRTEIETLEPITQTARRVLASART